jgi:type 1 glutamine amidotransferase
MNWKYSIAIIIFVSLMISCTESGEKESSISEGQGNLKALIIDGQNNHGVFPKTTMMMKDYLEETGLFTVDIERTKYLWQGPHHNEIEGIDTIIELLEKYPLGDGKVYVSGAETKADPDFSPDFKAYDVVISNFGWKTANWPAETKTNFESFVKDGGGFVSIHAANNSFGDWDEYNNMIGVGGWGGRDSTTGAYIYYDKSNQFHRDTTDGPVGSHGPQAEFAITTREADHPIMKGLPKVWMHTQDEMYDRMRGPAENVTILATAFSDVDANTQPWNANNKGSDRHEPMLMTLDYGQGRVFHTVLGHMDYSVECVGFMTIFQRGVEWAASGKVTQDVPSDFPSPTKSSSRKWDK